MLTPAQGLKSMAVNPLFWKKFFSEMGLAKRKRDAKGSNVMSTPGASPSSVRPKPENMPSAFVTLAADQFSLKEMTGLPYFRANI